MNTDELVAKFKLQLEGLLNSHTASGEKDPVVSFGAGMLVILSALKLKDGSPSMGFQVACMHAALRQIGKERGWGVGSANDRPGNYHGYESGEGEA